MLLLLLFLTAYSATTVQAALQKLITNPKRADNGEDQVRLRSGARWARDVRGYALFHQWHHE